MNRAEGGKPAVKITICIHGQKSKDYVIKKEVVYQSKKIRRLNLSPGGGQLEGPIRPAGKK